MSCSLITKPGGKVTAQNDAAVRRGVYGGGDACVLGFGQKMRYEIVNNNTIRVYDGVMISQGMHIQIDPNTYEEFTFENGAQGVTRYDAFGFEITTGESYEFEKFVNKNVTDNESILNTNDLWGAPSGTKTQAGLYMVRFDGLSITEVYPLFDVASKSLPELHINNTYRHEETYIGRCDFAGDVYRKVVEFSAANMHAGESVDVVFQTGINFGKILKVDALLTTGTTKFLLPYSTKGSLATWIYSIGQDGSIHVFNSVEWGSKYTLQIVLEYTKNS